MPPLSKRQFAQLAEDLHPKGEEDSGFTIKHSTGYRPTHGVAVALAGGERELEPHERTPAAIEQYVSQHGPSLSQRGVYLGGWAPGTASPFHGTATLDNTRIVRNRHRAVDEVVMQNQKAGWDLDEDAPINNVYRQVPTTFQEPAGFDRPQFERDVADLYRKARGRRSLAADEASVAGR
jgi:hypothetical protein